MPGTTDDWFGLLAGSHWLTRAPARIVRAAPAPDGRWTIGGLSVTKAELEAARPNGPIEQVRSFTLLHGGWRVASFTLFRPLVYFAAFGADEIFDCLACGVSSLLGFGGWQWDVLVLTAPAQADHVRSVLAPAGLGPRLHVATVTPCDTPLDWCMARYRLDAHPIAAAAQPMLYLDVDIVCDRPLEPLLALIAESPSIHACAEGRLGEGDPASSGHWFGWRLLAEDDAPFDREARGFSAGALGMANAASARPAFPLIMRSVYADAAQSDGGRKLAGLDQPFANYVMRKLGCIDTGPMSQVLKLHRLDIGQSRFPTPLAAKGLVHFLGAPTSEKLAAMRAYVAALHSTRAAPSNSAPA